ncbi:hypothetical protein BDZ90DRAFT_63006 [Jaminaea rosea]|uniref:HECT-type E3 ubiquitin transferase n=1 Tax=Jaminaea rosea TaxID=1569628 RepID=A0A316UKL6_9BASI|nr:hypothetical protein BDZ90DRAFT_63006 [Jaminaea rosea]PWN25797.1 hypothetical protein BDZ90DRAFT_63006 [Jaminaea rosea]
MESGRERRTTRSRSIKSQAATQASSSSSGNAVAPSTSSSSSSSSSSRHLPISNSSSSAQAPTARRPRRSTALSFNSSTADSLADESNTSSISSISTPATAATSPASAIVASSSKDSASGSKRKRAVSGAQSASASSSSKGKAKAVDTTDSPLLPRRSSRRASLPTAQSPEASTSTSSIEQPAKKTKRSASTSSSSLAYNLRSKPSTESLAGATRARKAVKTDRKASTTSSSSGSSSKSRGNAKRKMVANKDGASSSSGRRTSASGPSTRRKSSSRAGNAASGSSAACGNADEGVEDDSMHVDIVDHDEDDEADDYEDVDEDSEDEEEQDSGNGDRNAANENRHPLADDDDDDDEGHPFDDEEMFEDGFGGSDFANVARLAGYLGGGGSRYRQLLASLRNRKDPTTQLIALQELSEALSLANEDTLQGHFSTESFVSELVSIMGGPRTGDDGEQAAEENDDASAAVALTASGLVDQGEMTLLACRCLANLIEAMPYAAHTVVAYGAIPVLLSKLTEIEFIDLAEQTLQTLEKISAETPTSIVQEGGLMAMLQFLDFFNIHIQRTAMTAAANCCRRLSASHFEKVKDIIPIIRNVLGYADQRLVESACKCVVRIIESFRHQPDCLEQLVDKELVQALNALLLHGSPGSASAAGVSASASIGQGTYTDVLKSFSSAVKASPKVAVILLETNVVETLYTLLTGSAPPAEDGTGGRGPAAFDSQGTTASAMQLEAAVPATADDAAVAVVGAADGDSAGQGVAVADMAVLQNLAHRPKEQVQEALSLVSELLPPLPREGVFDHRAYSEKAWHKKRKSARDQAGSRRTSGSTVKAEAATPIKAEPGSEADGAIETSASPVAAAAVAEGGEAAAVLPVKQERVKSEKELMREQAQNRRTEMLREQDGLIKRFTQLVLPTLVEVYAASVALHVRVKALQGILKIISFVDAEKLNSVLDNVPLAGFIGAILSSRDDPSVVLPSLQMVELLCNKLPEVYKSLLRREGVMWEIEDIASKQPNTTKYGTNASSSAQLSLPVGQGASSPSNASAAATNAAASAAASTGVPTIPTLNELGATSAAGLALGRAYGSSTSATLGRASATTAATPTPQEQQDALIWRSRILRDRFNKEAANAEGGANHAVRALEEVSANVSTLADAAHTGPTQAAEALERILTLFSKPEEPISSFELLRSGLIDGLYNFATEDSVEVPAETRRQLLIDALMAPDAANHSRGSSLVRRLQESLNRLENLDISTAVGAGQDDMRRYGSAAGIHRQIRLRLQAEEGTETPRSVSNLVVGIHAIASLDRLAEFLRPKLQQAANGDDGGLSRSARLTSMLAALSGGAGGLEGALAAERAALLGRAAPATGGSGGQGGLPSTTSASATAAPTNEDSSSSSSAAKKTAPRRSSRLTRKNSGGSGKSEEAESAESDTKGKSSAAATTSAEDAGNPAVSSSSAATGGAHDPADGPSSSSDPSRDAARSLMQSLLGDALDDEAYAEEEEGLGEEIFEDEVGPADGEMIGDTSAADKTVNLAVAEDGKKVEVKTPDGTRVPTPAGGSSTALAGASSSSSRPASNSNAGASSSSSAATGSSSGSRPSYSAALQRKPSDWHIRFSMDGRELAVDSTIYGAVHTFENSPSRAAATAAASNGIPGSSSSAVASLLGGRNIWNNVYTLKFRKVVGAAPRAGVEQTPEPESGADASSSSSITAITPPAELPESIPADSPFGKILQLLKVLHSLNAQWRQQRDVSVGSSVASSVVADGKVGPMSESAFVNNKLTAKLNRQLEEPMIVASKCLPDWSVQMPTEFPFLFPFEARYAFLQLTAFGYNRMLHRWQSMAARNQENATGGASASTSRYDDQSLAHLVRLPRAKVRIARENILPSAFRVMDLYGSKETILEVEYFNEVGTGLGPTLEFYALTSKEFARKDLQLWRDSTPADSTTASKFVYAPRGLFPLPLSQSKFATQEGKRRIAAFKILGQFVAKALLDSRIIDCDFSPVFMRAVLTGNRGSLANMATLKAVDSALASSLEKLLSMSEDDLTGMAFDFTLPGDEDYELKPNGKSLPVTPANVAEYIDLIIDATVRSGIAPLIKSFRAGFNSIFPIKSMASFTADELVMLFGNTDEDWSESTLVASIKPDHGYNAESATFRDLLSLMASFNLEERREFLQWLTGSPKLPIGGFGGLQPQLTVVKRPHEAPFKPDDYLASNMSCANFLKLPEYSSKETMRRRLQTAVREGAGAFNLS